jgi:hypothetical protein
MADTMLVPGDILDVSLHRFNYGEAKTADEFVVLEVAGSLFFWPEWTSQLGGDLAKTIQPGDSTESILYFEWPDIEGSMSGLHFFAALFDAGVFNLIGFDAVEFSYLPA